MWAHRSEPLANGRILKVSIDQNAAPLPFADTLVLWQNDADFRSYFMAILADAPFAAFRWETPPITASSAQRPFEFVLLDSPGLASNSDPDAFAEHFSKAKNKSVPAFPNLGKDAMLIVPTPRTDLAAYGHLAAFIRGAPEPQRHSLWQSVGKTMQETLGTDPLWLSTAGAGVSWLHVRLDKKPKYYGYQPYWNMK